MSNRFAFDSICEESKNDIMSSQYRHPIFTNAMNEHFDISDDETRRVLLSVNEADQNQVLTALTSKLYDNIVEKVDDIDYGDIPVTKGDITKLPNYQKLESCIDIMEQILKEFKQDTEPVLVLDRALENIKSRREMFEKAFRYNIELPVVCYCTLSLAVISSTSLMISSCIDFIKTPSDESFSVSFDKVGLAKSKQHMLFENLQKFNDMCKKGDFDKAMEFVINNKIKNFTGSIAVGLVGSIALIGVLLNIVPILRELVFFFYYTRTRVSDYFDIQADLLQMNAYNLEQNESRDPEERKKIAKKQFGIATIFRKISDKIAINSKESEVKATKELSSSAKKFKTSEIMDEMPDSASSSLF